MTDPEAWSPRCVLCAARGVTRELDTGHCCAACRTRIDDDLRDIVRLCADAAAWVMPGTSSTGYVAGVAGSRPPLSIEAIEPEYALVRLDPDDPSSDLPILEALENWERLLRDERGFAPYGPASLARNAAQEAREGTVGAIEAQGAVNATRVTLTGVVGFLRAQLDYATTEPTFALEDFAREIRLCVNVLRRFDPERDGTATWRVDCPHDTGEGTCGKALRIGGDDLDRYFDCPRCGTEWSGHRLLLVAADTSDAAMWLDSEAICERAGITRKSLERWVREGKVAKQHGLYDARPILAVGGRLGA